MSAKNKKLLAVLGAAAVVVIVIAAVLLLGIAGLGVRIVYERFIAPSVVTYIVEYMDEIRAAAAENAPLSAVTNLPSLFFNEATGSLYSVAKVYSV